MQILAIEREVAPIDSHRHRDLLREEAACVWELKKKELVRDIWFTVPGRLAVVMLECASKEEAQRHLAALPLVREGLIAFDVMALRSYDGFDRLVTAQSQTRDFRREGQQGPNQAPEPTPGSVTDRADARSAPAPVVAHL